MQILYPDYKFNMIPIIVGALGYIPKCLKGYICDLGFDEKEAVKHMIKGCVRYIFVSLLR